jgi:hypothetical protein
LQDHTDTTFQADPVQTQPSVAFNVAGSVFIAIVPMPNCAPLDGTAGIDVDLGKSVSMRGIVTPPPSETRFAANGLMDKYMDDCDLASNTNDLTSDWVSVPEKPLPNPINA